jgi:hypothetical protein
MGTDWAIFGPLLAWLLTEGLALAAFGAWFNRLVKTVQTQYRVEGIESLLVAAGTAVTLLLAYPLTVFIVAASGQAAWVTALLVLLGLLYCFAASGAPMMYGSISRYLALKRQKDEHANPLQEPGL